MIGEGGAPGPRTRRRLPARTPTLGLAALLALLACTREAVTSVTVEAVTVLPATVTVLENETVQLSAEVRDEEGRRLERVEVTWSSEPPAMLAVSATGLVSPLRVGSAAVIASYGGVRGSASVTVIPVLKLRVEPDAVLLRGAVGGEAPRPVELDVDNEGSQPVRDLEAAVAYPAGSRSGWLEARLESRESPTELELRARVSDLAAGIYDAAVHVWGRDTEGFPAIVPVVLTLAGVQVNETGGGTVLRRSDDTDEIEVVLLLRPNRDVVLAIESADSSVATVRPGTLLFTPDTWDEPQTLTVATGSRTAGWFWGVDETDVTIAVDPAGSDPLYEPVEATTIRVRVERRIFGVQTDDAAPLDGAY